MSTNNIEVKTPYAYAFGAILTLMSQQITELDKQLELELKSITALNPRLMPNVRAKYLFALEQLLKLYYTVTEVLDMAIPDEEKVILDTEFQKIKSKIAQVK